METTEEEEKSRGEAEERRRKIVERGSDRMALITGRIQTLPSSSPSSAKHSYTQSSPSLFFQDHSLPPQPPRIPSDHIRVGHKGEDNASGVSFKRDINHKFSRGNAFNFRGRPEPQLRKCETDIVLRQSPDVEVKEEAQPLVATTKKVHEPLGDRQIRSKAGGSQFNLFSAKDINCCIVASEGTRVFCAVIIASLVVLSNVNLPSNIVKSESTISSRPLYILLLTDVTIVLVRLLGKRRGPGKSEKEEKLGPLQDEQNWEGAFTILEMGLVFYQTIRAIFIDFSFYTVVVICGLSVV